MSVLLCSYGVLYLSHAHFQNWFLFWCSTFDVRRSVLCASHFCVGSFFLFFFRFFRSFRMMAMGRSTSGQCVVGDIDVVGGLDELPHVEIERRQRPVEASLKWIGCDCSACGWLAMNDPR